MQRRPRRFNRDKSGYLFVMPSFLAMMVFAGIPIMMTIPLAFTDWNLISGLSGIQFVGFRHFVRMWSDPWFIASLRNTVVFAVSTVAALILFGLILAAIVDREVFSGDLFRVMIFTPYIVNIATVAVIWRVLLSSRGPITGFLTRLGMDPVPVFLASPQWALPSLVFISVWNWIGYVVIVYVAAMRAVPQELFEAAEIDGANRLQQLLAIKLPLISPTTMFLTTTMIINSFRSFALVQIMTQGGPARSTSVLVFYLYRAGFAEYRFGYSSAMSIMLFLIILVITVAQWYGQQRWVVYR